jgi:prepilin-type N-terminal cleavage/methylation domain-containing protein
MKKKGFTLLELLVSAGVLSLVSVIIAQVLFTTVRLNTKTEQVKEMKQTGTASMETIRRMIQNARTVSSLCTGLPQSELAIVDVEGRETVLRCIEDVTYTARSVYRIASESAALGTQVFLTSGNVTLVDRASGEAGCGLIDTEDSALQFVCSLEGGKVTSVSIRFSLRQQHPTTGVFEGETQIFESTGTMRNN